MKGPDTMRRRLYRTVSLVLLLASLLAFGGVKADAGIWSVLGKSASKSAGAGAKAGKLGVGLFALEDAAGVLARLPSARAQGALGAHVTPEGHWTFLNKEGDTFTAAYPHEMERLNAALVPNLPADSKLSLYLSEESAFANPQALKALPANAELHVVAGKDSYGLVRSASDGSLKARVRPNLTVDMTSQTAFEEAVFLLGRPLNKSNVRMLAIEPGGPKQLSSVPQYSKADKTTLVDAIDPSAVYSALGKVRGQTLLVTGRVEGDALHVGASEALSIDRLRAAAEGADANLVILQQSTARQPGARNWLWQKAEVEGLQDALSTTTYADFFDALGTSRGSLTVSTTPDGYGRTLLQAVPPPSAGGSLTDYVPWAGDKTGEWFGNIGVHSVSAFVRAANREQELDARFVPGIPSWLQILALGNLITGLIAYEVSWRWWGNVWPPETRGEYGSAWGYNLARVVRFLAYVLIFLPIFGGLSFAWLMALAVRDALHAPARWVRAIHGWFAARRTT